MIYSFEPIASKKEVAVDGVKGFIRSITTIQIQTPEGFVLEQVKDVNPYGDIGFNPMVFDPIETAKGTTGRVYMRAARLVERMRSGYGDFAQVG
jgi:hypothetical protein